MVKEHFIKVFGTPVHTIGAQAKKSPSQEPLEELESAAKCIRFMGIHAMLHQPNRADGS
jgi:hypothetical protein